LCYLASKMTQAGQPSYDLLLVQQLVGYGRFQPSWSVLSDLEREKLDEEDLIDCVLALGPSDFFKSMPFEKNPSFMLDVYSPVYDKRRMYLKFRLTRDNDFVHIDSFRRSTSR
jgi:hypothetical protein